MRTYIFISSLLLLVFKSSQGSFTDNVDQWISFGSSHQLSAREALPNTGYWNFLLTPLLGLPGRALHFLLTDSRGFGEEIKKLDYLFKQKHGDEKYVNLEREIVETFPYGNALIKGMKLLDRVNDVRDPETGKTIRDAFDIIQKISADRAAVKDFINRWGMIEHVDNIFANPADTSPAITPELLKKMRDTLLNNPKVYRELFSDPEIMSRITSTVLESLQNIDWAKGINSAIFMIRKLKNSYPELIEGTTGELFNIRDEQTQLSFAECLQALANIMKTPEFANEFKNLVNEKNLILIHEKAQQIIPELLGDGQTLTAQKLNEKLADFGFSMPPKTVEDMLAHFADGSIFKKVDQFFEEAAARPGGLTAKNVEAQVQTVGITDLNEENIVFLAEILAEFDPEQMVPMLKTHVGLDIPLEEAIKFRNRCAEIARSANQRSSALTDGAIQTSDYTQDETPQPTDSTPDETTQ